MSLKVEKIYKSDEEWKDLTPEQFRVLRKVQSLHLQAY